MLYARRWTFTLLTLGLLAWPALAEEERAIVVIVHKSNQMDKISLNQLKKIFTLEEQTWSDGGKIRAYIHKAGSFEQQILLDKIYRMNEAELNKLWLKLLADNESSKPPASTSRAIKRAVAKNTRAIGVIDMALSDATVKVLRVNGQAPESNDYPLKE